LRDVPKIAGSRGNFAFIERELPMMKVSQILEHFLARSPWVDRKTTVDRVIMGDPDTKVDFCAVTWMPSFEALRKTVELGAPLLMCHEPTFWDHWDNLAKADPRTAEKVQFVQDHKLVIVRNHDCWDLFPKYGVPFRWAKFLGFKGKPATTNPKGFQLRFDVKPVALKALAKDVAKRCKAVGEEKVQVIGDLSKRVTKIGIGTGCYCNMRDFIQMGCDCTIIADDSGWYWEHIQMAEDLGMSVIRVNHGTSEEYGLEGLAEYINKEMKGLRAEFIPHGCCFKLVG
jgi:putative NIF3 family GTP cyclohydrolase 1 type 2